VWSEEEVAELLRVSKQTIRRWVVKEHLVEYRLAKVARCKVKVLVTTSEVMRLLDIKRPIFGTGSPEEQIFNRERAMKSRAGLAASANRMARLQRELEKGKEPS
jgi:excisionase family DNA binding protein